MTAKEHLQKVRRMDAQIDSKLEQLARLRSLAEGVTAAYSLTPKGNAPNNSRIEHCIAKIIELEAELDGDVDACLEQRRSARELITSLPNETERVVLEYYYLCGNTWGQVARKMNYSKLAVMKIRDRAFQRLSKNVYQSIPLDML